MNIESLTETYLAEQRKRIVHNKMTYIKQTLNVLQEHLNGDYILHPKEIKSLISNCLESILTFNDYCMDKYDELSAKEKDEVNNRYEKTGKWEVVTGGRDTAPEQKTALWQSMEEHYKQYVGEAYEFLDRR